MNCPLETREELLVAYSSRQLDPPEVKRIEVHLAECPACREFVAAQQAVWEALDLWEPAPVSLGFNRQVYQALEQKESFGDRLMAPLRAFLRHRGIPVAAAASLLFAAGLLLRPTATPPVKGGGAMAQVEPLRPEQVVNALDELESITQFDRLMKSEPSGSNPKM